MRPPRPDRRRWRGSARAPAAPRPGRPERFAGPGEEALGDLARRAPADAGDAGDRQDVLDEGLGRLRRLPLDGGEQAGMLWAPSRPRSARLAEALARDDGADHPPLGGGRHAEGIDERVEQPHVAEPHRRAVEAEPVEPLDRKGQDLRIRRRGIGPADGFDARLEELAGLARGAAGRPARHRSTRRGPRRGARGARGRPGSCIRAAGRIPRRPHPASRTSAAGCPRPTGRRTRPPAAAPPARRAHSPSREQRDQGLDGLPLRHWRLPPHPGCSLAMPGREGDAFREQG